MADAKYLKEDDYLSVSDDTASIVYHPNLNVILVFTQSGEVRVLDVNSGIILHSCCLAGDECQVPRAKYLPDQDKVLFWNQAGVLGLRGDYNGVLLLDTILQTPVCQSDDTVKVELLLSEAVLLLQSIQNLEQQGLENTTDVINELNLKISETQQNNKKGIKAQRWETICLELPHSNLKMVASGVVLQLKRLGRHIPALAIASAVNERLADLIVGGRIDPDNAQRFHMFSEAARRQTFDQWPHMDYKWALPDQMAQAGFYHQPGDSGGDRAMCFTCNVCLVCWEKTDEPWSEHERHSPDCPFVKGEYTQNVPLPVTYATSPATPTPRFTQISNGVHTNIVCTGNRDSEVKVWNVERQLQQVTKFHCSDIDKCAAFTTKFNVTGKVDTTLTALATYSRQLAKNSNGAGATKKLSAMSSKAKMLGTKIVAGVAVTRSPPSEEVLDDDAEKVTTGDSKLVLVVYQLTETVEKKDHNNVAAQLGAKKSNSTLSTIEERFEDDEFMKFLASETDLQQLQLLESIIDMDPTTKAHTTASNKISECDEMYEESKNDDQKLSKLKASATAWSQTDSSTVGPATETNSTSGSATAGVPQTATGIMVSPVQFVPVVPCVPEDYEIDEIIPSCDTKYLLVVLRPRTSDDMMETDATRHVQLMLFGIEENGLLDETPVCVRILDEKDTPVEICMLPRYEGKRRVFEGPECAENGIFAMTTTDGSLQLVSLTALKTISDAKVESGKFVSATYCKSLERICACTDRGSLHFYSFYEFDADSSDDRDEECETTTGMAETASTKSNIIYDAMPSTSTQTATPSTSRQESELIAFRNNLTLNDLRVLYSLTLFEELPLPYNAEVPGCWSELIQAQKQRRNPNLLRPGDDSNLTRTWRLHNDATTWDEHLIEINLPKSVPQSIGHIDFKFTLYQPCTNPPAIQVTLLKQKSFGLCCRRKQASGIATEFASSSSDSKESYENPVLSDEYLQARNSEILVGPIELSSCMDLSEQGGIVTLTSPKLLKSKSRNFLLHIKTVADVSKDGQGKTRGCDWLHEISITVRATRHIHKVTMERSQRLAMLESNQLLDNLLKLVARDDKMLLQNLAFDILNWIATIRMTRYRSPLPTMHKRSANEPAPNSCMTASLDMNEQQSECIEIISSNLVELIRQCMVLSNRSIAHKCSKLLLTVLEGAQNMPQVEQCQVFEDALKTSITTALPNIVHAEHAGALRWFTLLISGTSTLDAQNEIAERSISLLVDLSREIVSRNDPYTMLLRSRFGLYGLPFEPELFDAELPNMSKCSNLMYTYVPVTKPPGVQIQLGGQVKNVCMSADSSELRVLPLQLRRKGIGNHFKGALEVEPLHFICCSTSEATRLENTDSALVQSNHIIDDILLETPMTNIETSAGGPTSGVKKEAEKENLDDDMMNNVKNILVDKIFSSAIKKNKLKEDIKEAAKSFDLEVSELSGFNENDTATDDWGAPETRVVFLTNNSGTESNDAIMGNAPDRTTTTSASLNNKIQEFFEENNAYEETAFQWHKILSTPPKQTIVVDRMHSGARRFVTLDFGQPTMLTDLIIPSYPDLASITIDIWCFEEEADSVRLVVSQDIGSKSLVLSDLQPPPICRFLKMTFTGRYGMTGTRCKIPMGAFFGHVVIVEREGYADPVMKYINTPKSNTSVQLKVLNALFEDVHCRYCLSNSKLQEFLQPFLNNETSNMAHMQAFLNKTRDSDDSNQGYAKIVATYEECIYFQYQLNLIKRVIDRIESINSPRQVKTLQAISELSTDKLRVLSECLIEVLLHCVASYTDDLSTLIDKETCNLFFDTIINVGDTHTQLAMCSLLVRVCGFQPWWGQFIANIFNRLFSVNNTQIFPQDRVFFLLTYLGRKTLAMGTCRTLLIDSFLKAIAGKLVPLSQNPTAGLWHSTDLTQLSWLLLFLSVCSDDGTEKKESTNYRWDFMSGEGDMAKARMTMCNNSQRNFSRSFKKRYIQKQPLTTTHNVEKYSMVNQDYLLFTSNPVQLEQALKHHDLQLKKLQSTLKGKMQSFGDYFNEITMKKQQQQAKSELGGRAFQSTSTASAGTSTEPPIVMDLDSSFDKALKNVRPGNMIVVIRGLIGLILSMDFTCNMDLFLLTCKIIARLVFSCRPSVQLSRIITSNQLLQLLRIAVWENQQQPWAVHAITCLLQDILDADKNYQKTENEDEGMCMEVDSEEGAACSSAASSSSSSASNLVVDMANASNNKGGIYSSMSPLASLSGAHSLHPALYADVVKGKLPSLMECEDAEMDDILDTLDNLIEREKTRKKKEPTSSSGGNRSLINGLTVLYRSVSSAMDARLEHGLDTTAEIALRRLTMKSSLKLFPVLSQSSQPNAGASGAAILEPEIWPTELLDSWSHADFQNQRIETNAMLVEAFDHIFFDLHLEESWLDLEKVMQIWLTLNGEVVEQQSGNGFGHHTFKPKIALGDPALHALMRTLATVSTVKLRAWCLGFQCLIMACKPPVDAFDMGMNSSQEKICHRMGLVITEDANFESILLRFFSGTDRVSCMDNSRYAGPTICKLIVELFGCLANKCGCKIQLKEILLRVLLHLVHPGGAITMQQGPIDAQGQLVKELLKYTFDKTDLGAAMSIVESISHLVYNNIVNEERIYCKKSADNGNNNNVFGSLFATVLGSENSRHCKTVTDNTVLVSLLKLALILIKTKIPRPGEDLLQAADVDVDGAAGGVDSESQTDESKAAEQEIRQTRYFADTILQFSPTMQRLLNSLSFCSNSSFAMLVASSAYSGGPSSAAADSKNVISEPQTVADALFQLLISLTKIATHHELIIRPLYDFLNSASNQMYALPRLHLSEPFLWFILKVLESQEAVNSFASMGGIRVLCQSLVRSNRTLINSQQGLVSMIMQHISKTSGNLQSNLAGALKKTNIPTTKNEEGLINFAPYCTISSDNPTAQPSDVLIQNPIASHRRARTPAWSYLFYPNESHVDLNISLPAAVLLKEIQLQPHVSTLASCPSAVAVEITRDGNLGPLPISTPISTVGMTCIRLKFNQPEIATGVVIRLYRPKDSTNIGLTQILLLGSTVFSENSNSSFLSKPSSSGGNTSTEFGEDDVHSKTSLGWLRVLAQCFNVATFNQLADGEVSSAVIAQAAEVPGFLESCCTLLTVAAPNPNYALSNLETVLLKLGLHNLDLGLKLIDGLLKLSLPQNLKMNNDAVSDLLYVLCTTQDNYTRNRIETMLKWVENLYLQYEQNRTNFAMEPVSGHVKCLSSILWQAYATTLVPDLPNMITKSLFDILYNWNLTLETNESMKHAIDAMLCSICCIRPELFTVLLREMGVLIPNLSPDLSAPISDDRKEDCLRLDSGATASSSSSEWYSHLTVEDLTKLDLNPAQLDTIAMACQSPLAVQLLIDSGLPRLFTFAILEFCQRELRTTTTTDVSHATYPMVDVIKITEILNFFSDICAEGSMRDWLGSYEGTVFWETLLHLLCNNKIYSNSGGSMITPQPYLKLEEAVIKFMSRVTTCHPSNQETFTTTLIYAIRKAESQESNNLNGYKSSISGFTRRLVLQILLESEKIMISVRSELPLQKKEQTNQVISNHPSKRPNSHHLLFYISTNSKCHQILEQCGSVYSNMLPNMPCEASRDRGDEPSSSKHHQHQQQTQQQPQTSKHKTFFDLNVGMGLSMELLSVAAGVTAKDKRIKEAKNQAATLKKDFFNVFKMKMDDQKSMSQIVDCGQLIHTSCPDFILSNDTSISQILAMLKANKIPLSNPCINLTLVQGQRTPPCSDEMMRADDDTPPMKAADFVPLPSPLQIFSSRGGLSLLAHYLPTVYPETPKSQMSSQVEKDKAAQQSNDWVKVEPNEEIYEDLDDTLTESSSKLPIVTSVPQHSLAAFGLFLKLPAYSEVLLRDKLKAQCLLRLILGVTGDGEGNEIYSLALSSTLPTLPFEVFRQLLDSSPLTTDDGVLLRRMVIEVGAIHLVLNCLGIFTHHTSQTYQVPGAHELQPNVKTLGSDDTILTSDDKGHMYWAKGTGFGTGSTQQSWNVEQALLRQKSEEEHVTVLLQVLSSYVNPGDKIPPNFNEDSEMSYRESSDVLPELPPIFLDLLQQSCLIAALSSYLRNDSVLDITRHIPLYRAILQLLRAISLSSQLISLLMMRQNGENRTSIATLLSNMKACVDTYATRLKVNKKGNPKNGNSSKVPVNLDDGDDEGLALLIPDIQETFLLVQNATSSEASSRDEDDATPVERPMMHSVEDKYLELMKKLQFDTYEMIAESENGYRFTVSYHFETNVRMAGDRGHPARVKRLAQETVTLSTSLPLSYSSSVFVRCDTDRLDVMKVLITGPAETPYANGCFEFDVYFPPDYPNSPMMINLETTGRHSIRFNPNLYNDGKVCLSVLNTWHGRPEEKWNAQTSSFLQVLVSIQSLILVSEPYFNEPGFERSRGTPSATHSSREYNSNIYQATVRWAMLEQLKNPCSCFKEVIHTHFWLKRNEICTQIESWIAELSKPQYSGRTISFNSMALRRHYRQLREELAKLPPPPGLEEMNHPFSAAVSLASPPNLSSAGITMSGSSTSSQMNDMDFAVTPPKIDDDLSVASTLLNELSQHVMFNNTATTETNTTEETSATINSMDDDNGSSESNHDHHHHHHHHHHNSHHHQQIMNHMDGASSSGSSSASGSKEQIDAVIIECDDIVEEESKNDLEDILCLEDGDSSE